MTRISLATLLLFSSFALLAESFTYRGTLEDGGVPAAGTYDLQLRLYADAQGKHALSGPIDLRDVGVVDGRFAVSVDVPGLPPHLDSGWLEVAVKSTDDGAFWPLPERSQVLLKGTICPASWALAGNAGTDPSLNFLGTTDDAAFEVRTRNSRHLRIEPSSILVDGEPITANVLLGSRVNELDPGLHGATISGGGMPEGSGPGGSTGGGPNRVTHDYGTVGGGFLNLAGPPPGGAPSGNSATVGGGSNNHASGTGSTIAGGQLNFASDFSAVAGGLLNEAIGPRSSIGGGTSNTTLGETSVVLGGADNTALGLNSTVSGGRRNCAGAELSWAGGFRAKVRPAEDPDVRSCRNLESYPGGLGDRGTFVWADSQSFDFVSTGPDQFLVRAQGGVGINTSAPGATLHVRGADNPDSPAVALFEGGLATTVALASSLTSGSEVVFSDTEGFRSRLTTAPNGRFSVLTRNGIWLRPDFLDASGSLFLGQGGRLSLGRGGNVPDADKAIQVGSNTSNGNGAHLTNTGVWTNASSRSFKHAFEAVDTSAILDRLLALPVQHWSYRGNDTVRHLGPTAEDFRAAFGLGHDERYIGAVDADGVALAAIQGLNAKLETENAALRDELAELRADLAALRELLAPALSQEVR